MTSFFKRLVSSGDRPPADSGAGRLTLAVFGKHPGWNDHLPGIGVETETLAHVKQSLYVTGIGGRIDAGAWKSLEAAKRLEGFDHTFLWLRDGHVVLGQMHSSEDGLRRKEYPLVLCVDGEGIAPGELLARAGPELNRLREACRATTSADGVTMECRSAQERLRAIATGGSLSPGGPSAEIRRNFLEHSALGPDRVGLLRILHELGINADARAKAGTRSRHVRLPQAADSGENSLVLWAEFLRRAISTPTSLLLIARRGVDWVDAILGEPASDDFFCLQASTSAQPLASQIPYELSPELTPRLWELEAKFLGGKPAGDSALPPSPPPPKILRVAEPSPPAAKGGRGWLGGLVVLLLAGAGVGIWLFNQNRTPPPVQSPAPPAASPGPVAGEPGREPGPESGARVAEPAQPTATNQPPPPETPRVVETKPTVAEAPPTANFTARDAKTKAEDADLAQLAVGRGDYVRALEICGKWPDTNPFTEMLARIKMETNQLSQASEALKAGQYDPILTNRFPDNPRFQQIVAQAQTEKAVLTQALADHKQGNYAFLQRPAVLELKEKPPFRAVLEAGQFEAEQLEKVQALKTGNQPQEVLALLERHKLEKPPFVPFLNWAKAETASLAAQKGDQQRAEAAFQQGNYEQALALCARHPGISEFSALSNRIAIEQRKLTELKSRFAAADYAFLGEMNTAYADKPPFAELLTQAKSEQNELTRLSALTNQTTGWKSLAAELQKLPAETVRKEPFAHLGRWAQEKAATDEELKSRDPAWLDAIFEPMLVQFAVLGPKHRWLQSPEAAKAEVIQGSLSEPQRAYYLNRAQWLRQEYEKRGWLKLRDREKYLDQLERNIKFRS